MLGVVWSFTEVVTKLPPWRDVVVLGVPLLENATVFSGDQDRVHTKRRKGWGGLEAVAEQVAVLVSRTRLSSREKDLAVLVEGLVVLKAPFS